MILMLNYARSGGTLLNRALAADDRLVVLSEVSRLGSGAGLSVDAMEEGAISYQLKQWYDIELQKTTCFNEELSAIKSDAALSEKMLIRDWTFINFYPHYLNAYSPSYKLPLEDYSSKYVFALLRNPYDIWVSRDEPISVFFRSYKRYLSELKQKKIKLFYYEDMVEEPKKFFDELYRFINKGNRDDYLNFYQMNNVFGDTQVKTDINQSKSFVKRTKNKAEQLKFEIYMRYIEKHSLRPLVEDKYITELEKRDKIRSVGWIKPMQWIKYIVRFIREDFRWRF